MPTPRLSVERRNEARRKGKASLAPVREFGFTDDDFFWLSRLIGSKTGIVLKDHKQDMVYGRLARRLRVHGLTTFTDYRDLLGSDEGDAEMGMLVNAITTNLTHFFREIHHFKHLAKVSFKNGTCLDENKQRIRIWSAGCSSGAEPYSIAMTLRRAMPGIEAMDFRILASDLDTAMLEIGRSGEYPISMLDKIPKVFRSTDLEFDQEETSETFKIANNLRRMIIYKQLNLLNDWPMKGHFDIIFCRNVMIYFDETTKNKLVSRFAEYLKPGGLLYVGHSETLANASEYYDALGQTIYKKK